MFAVSCQSQYPRSITCYMKYQQEETRSEQFNMVLSHSYAQAHITEHVTPEGDPCSQVGCVCFSYFTDCALSNGRRNHYSTCTREDQQNRIGRWHRGWISKSKCEEMRRDPGLYQNLTCCSEDRCNDHLEKVEYTIKSNFPVQSFQTFFPQPTTSIPSQHSTWPSTSTSTSTSTFSTKHTSHRRRYKTTSPPVTARDIPESTTLNTESSSMLSSSVMLSINVFIIVAMIFIQMMLA